MTQIEPINDPTVLEQVKRGPGRPAKVVPMTASASESEAKPVAMIPVKLLYHYRPSSMNFKVIGDPAPPPLPGIAGDYRDKNGMVIGVKLWAGTTVELPRDEVLHLLQNETERVDNVIGPDGKPTGSKRATRHKFPLAERADALPV